MLSDRLFISPLVFIEMIEHSKEVFPEEACGILAGSANRINYIFKMANVEHSPVSYLMDSKEQFMVMKEIRQKGLEMLGIYHSHTSSDAYPSGKDIALAFYDVAYVIISLMHENPVVRAFRIQEQKWFKEIELIIG
ncbi:MAG: M67 family metallopeptidase [Thermodesulfovibrionales bacterium]|nr:M67 family metallopeptidase [Thermodesulfovibrionales bacterium]